MKTLKNIKHGMRYSRQYSIWHDMKNRCSNPNDQAFKDYGGRGIKVCSRWNKSFITFWEDMKEGYSEKLTIDRIDNNGNYELSNCRWSTPEEQSWNKRLYRNNKLGVKGIQLRKSGKYRARIRHKGELINLGTFDILKDAIDARRKAENRRGNAQ